MIAIVPTACGIETYSNVINVYYFIFFIAIVPTACGIETGEYFNSSTKQKEELQ